MATEWSEHLSLRLKPGAGVLAGGGVPDARGVLLSAFFFSSRRRHTRYIGDWSSDCALPIFPEFIKKVKDKNSEVRLMGFGHRVYKNYDPRAKIMQKMCHAVLKETGHGDDPMLSVALERSEERRVGKEWRARWGTGTIKE